MGQMKMQRLYGGVRLLGFGPSIRNVQRLDANVMSMVSFMARTGLQVNLSHFAALEKVLEQDMESLTQQVEGYAGSYINLDSSDQVSTLLFNTLGLKQARPRMTPSGERESVDNETLVAVQHDHPCVPLILQHRELSKLLGTYVRPMPRLAKRVKHGEWRMYPNFTTTRVPSGRLACKEPNLLAMPNRTARGRDIRKGFITDPGWCYVSVDLSQIEVRIAAHSSGDENLIKVYENDEDIYSDFAITAFQLPDTRYRDDSGKWQYPSVDKNEHRFPAKTCILAAIYEVTESGLLEQMPTIYVDGKPVWTESRCLSLLNAFYMKYKGVINDRKKAHAMARKYGYVFDMFGRLLHTAAVYSVHSWVVHSALREASNFRYQAGAQGIIKVAMKAVWDDIEQGGILGDVHPLLQLHDELLFECREDLADNLIELVKYRFEHCAPLRVPIKASGCKAKSWGDLEK
jgi:DNA polymerase I